MDLNKTQVFLSVALTGSFTLAANDLGMTKSKVSRQVRELEEELKVQLFHRTTRRISLTHMGQLFFNACEPLVAQLQETEQLLKSKITEPSGVLRVTYPSALGLNLFAEITNDFIKEYPKVQVEVILSDSTEDLVGQGIDCAIRGGVLDDSSIICRLLFSCERGIYGSPDYLDGFQEIQEPKDLSRLDWVSFKTWRQNTIKLIGENGSLKVPIQNQVMNVNSLLFLQTSLLNGVGVGVLPSFLSDAEISEGKLKRVLPDYRLEDIDFYLVYPNTSFISPALQAFKDFCYRRIEQLGLSN